MAIVVALNILKTGFSLIKRSVLGLMDVSLEKEDLEKIEKIFQKYKKIGLNFHQLKTRQSGQKKFVSFHLLFPNRLSIKKSHNLADKIEKEIKEKIKNVSVSTHLEPLNDPKSFED